MFSIFLRSITVSVEYLAKRTLAVQALLLQIPLVQLAKVAHVSIESIKYMRGSCIVKTENFGYMYFLY